MYGKSSCTRALMCLVILVNLVVLCLVIKRFILQSEPDFGTLRYVYYLDTEDVSRNKTGKPLKLKSRADEMIDELKYFAVDELDRNALDHFPIAIASSSEYFKDSMVAVLSIQKVLFNHKIVYYDLGLSLEEKTQVLRLCNVTYRTIDFEELDIHHLKDLKNFAYKIFVFHDMLRDHEAFLWLDPTVMLSQCFRKETTAIIKNLMNKGVVLFDHKEHSIYAVTHPAVYHSLPSNLIKLQNTDSYGTGIMMVSRQRVIVEKMLQWLLLCSLNRECIIPPGHHPFCGYSINKPYTREMMDHSAGCHLYDQAIINVLLANHFTFDTDQYTFEGEQCFEVISSAEIPDNLLKC